MIKREITRHYYLTDDEKCLFKASLVKLGYRSVREYCAKEKIPYCSLLKVLNGEKALTLTLWHKVFEGKIKAKPKEW